MDTSLLSFEDAFSKRLLYVPDYQRGYAWEEDNWHDLISDIELLPAKKEHYTGTLVLKKRDDKDITDLGGTRYTCYDIVDGQQRLTTTVILLDMIQRNLAGQASDTSRETSKEIQKKYLYSYKKTNDKLSKLTLNKDCQRFFNERILSEEPTNFPVDIKSHELLLEAKTYYLSHLNAKRESMHMQEFEEYLLELQDKIRNRLMMTVYEVKDSADVGIIFEVMNNRGKPLTELEKVKNYLLYLSSKLSMPESTLTDEINQAWATILKELQVAGFSSADEDQLLRAHWLMAYDHNRKKWNGSKSIKSHLTLQIMSVSEQKLHDATKKYIETLEESARAYCDIVNPERPRSFFELHNEPTRRTKIIKSGVRLCRIRSMASFLPLLLATRLKFDLDAYQKMVTLCEIYAFRTYKLLEKRSNAGQSKLFSLGWELFHGKKSIDVILDEIRLLTLYYCSNVKFKKQFEFPMEGDNEANWYNWSGIKYFLYEYEEYLAGKDGVRVEWEAIENSQHTIEHILPQTPTGDDADYWLFRFTDEERSRLTNNLGNLTLTQHNRDYWYYSFPRKKGSPGSGYCYANSNLCMERKLATYDHWTPETIEERHATMAAWAKTRWFLEEATVSSEAVLGDQIDDDSEES